MRLNYGARALLVGVAIMVFVIPIVGILWGRISSFVKAFREEVVGKHFAEISRFSAVLIAFSMGVSNMRKRRLRTTLTLITITLIVFSLISLTSIYLVSIVRTIPKPGKTYYDGILISEFRYLPSYLGSFLKAEIGDEAVICPRSWIYTSSGYVSVLGGQVPGSKIKVSRIMDQAPETRYVFSALLAVVARADNYPLWLLLVLFLGSTVGSVVLFTYLIPGIPATFLLLLLGLSSGWSFIYTLVGTRSYGVVGFKRDVPYLKEGVFLAYMGATGFNDTRIWFGPLIITTFGADFCYFMKIGQLCNTTSKSMYKTYFLVFPIAWLVGFIYVSALWNIAPMPSNVYPGTNIYWPIQARWLRLFASGGTAGLLNPLLVIGFFAIGLTVFAVSEAMRIGIPLIALSAGAAQPLPYSVSLLIGLLIGKLIERRMGRDFWSSYRNAIVAGISLGVGLIITISVAIGLILKNMWILPY